MPDEDLDTYENQEPYEAPDLVVLARCGKDVWNEFWKRAWTQRHLADAEPIDFSGRDLSDISFAGFRFPGQADFSEATFSDSSEDERQAANFTGAVFTHAPVFAQAEFRDGVDFTGARFFAGACFAETKFSWKATFAGIRFSDFADFKKARFCCCADFAAAKFLRTADFSEVQFSDFANFSGGSFFRKALFNEAYFRSAVDFSNQKFKGPTSFRAVIFSRAPLFHGASIHQGTKFGDIDKSFTDFRSEDAEQSYRTLKLAMGEQQARTEEAAFAALELKARRYRLKSEAGEMKFWEVIKKGIGLKLFLPWVERCGYWLWEKLSDSGRSFFRPFALYFASWGAFAAFYMLPCQGLFGDWWTGARYAFLKQLPFVAAFRGGPNRIGELETALFGTNFPPGWVDALNSVQAIVALALFFLMGLGIRHKFRLR